MGNIIHGFWTALIAGVLGVLLGVVLVSTGPSGVLKNPPLYSVLEKLLMFAALFLSLLCLH